MVGKSSMQKAMSVFLGTSSRKFDSNFLPSTRSIAFTKKIFEKVRGFPESTKGSAEDTVFNYKLIKNRAKFTRVKNAIVEWGMPSSLKEFFWKIYYYAIGDAESKIWIFPEKYLMSHNIKSLFIIFRYILGITILILGFFYNTLPFLLILFLFYIAWAYRKVYMEFKKTEIAIWGPILQFTSDLGVIAGFVGGLF